MAKKVEQPSKADRGPTPEQMRELYQEMAAAGLEGLCDPAEKVFKPWLKLQAEGDLFFFCRWIMGFKDLGRIHRETCDWLTDFRRTRRKLCMLPVGHLKTTLVSQGLPIHITIQQPASDLYFDGTYTGGRGCNARLVLGNENQKKAAENLSVIKETFETNPWIVWLWPDLVWENFNEAPRWNVEDLVLPRTRTFKEPTFTAFGIENAITGGHYDGIFPDDIATLAAAQSPPVMERAKVWLKRSFTRLHEPYESLHIGVGTHQNTDDVYLEWQRRADMDLRIRAIEEPIDGVLTPIWPERYTPAKLAKLREDTDAITWSLWYMNRPVTAGYSALDWSAIREFRWYGGTNIGNETPFGLTFEESDSDELFKARKEAMKNPLARIAHGIPLSPVKGNREAFIGRFFKSVDKDQQTHLRDKYGYDPEHPSGPAQTDAKAAMEYALGFDPRRNR